MALQGMRRHGTFAIRGFPLGPKILRGVCVKLQVKRLHSGAVIPTFATDGSACFDLTAAEADPPNGNTRVYSTGLAIAAPPGYYVELCIRSGLAFKQGFILANGIGVIDADFRGEVKVMLAYLGSGRPEWPWIGDRIAQGRLVRLTKTEIEEVTSLDETKRGEGGFGSTGK